MYSHQGAIILFILLASENEKQYCATYYCKYVLLKHEVQIKQ